jgi:hypothetical protein
MPKTIQEIVILGEKSRITWTKASFQRGWLLGWRKDVKGFRGKIFIIKNTGQYEFIVNHPQFVLYIFYFSVYKWKRVIEYAPRVRVVELKNSHCEPAQPFAKVELPQIDYNLSKTTTQLPERGLKLKLKSETLHSKEINIKHQKLETKIINVWKM